MTKRIKIIIALLIIFFTLLWGFQIGVINEFHLSNTDIIIYVTALQKISFDNINPFIPARQIHIFNDHFDPILFLVAPIVQIFHKVFGISPVIVSMIIEVLFFIATAFLILYLFKKKLITSSLITFVLVYFFYNPTTFDSLGFSIHPTTWSVFPIAILGWTVMTKRFSLIIVSSIFLMSFKEEFPFAILMLSFYYLIKKQKKEGLILFALAGIWILFVYKIRLIIWNNESMSYGSNLLTNFFSQPIDSIINFYLGKKVIQKHIALLFPIIFILILYFKQNKNISIKELDYSMLWMLIPVYVIRVITGDGKFYMNHYHMAPIVGFLTLFICMNCKNFEIKKKQLIFIIVFILVFSGETIIQRINIFNTHPFLRNHKISNLINQKKAVNESIDYLRQFPNDNIFTLVNTGTYLYNNNYVYFLMRDNHVTNSNAKANFYLIEKHPFGNLYNKNRQFFDEKEKELRQNSEIVIDNQYIFLAKKNNSNKN